jgi:hypothetical protein
LASGKNFARCEVNCLLRLFHAEGFLGSTARRGTKEPLVFTAKGPLGIIHAPGRGMSEPRKLRCYQYVNRPYAAVRDLFRQRPPEVFQRATTSAVERANAIEASLRAGVAGIDIGVDVRIHLHGIHDDAGVAGLSPVTRVTLAWEAKRAPAFFPVMRAELSLFPLTSTETQLELEGAYQPPLGALGNVADAALGHRVAEAAVHRFLDDIVEQIRRELPATT